MITLYTALVFFHILLFVFWLGADLGVAICGAQFRKRSYTIEQRLMTLKLLVMIDLGPRIAWCLMIASTISLLAVGGYWSMPIWGLAAAWAVSLGWTALVLKIHKLGQDPAAKPLKTAELALKYVLAAFYFVLGGISLATDAPLTENWLATKAVLFGFIFLAAILIDIMFKPVGPLLIALIEKGSSDETEEPLLKTMNKSRFWVRLTYLLLVIVAFIGTTKAF